MQTDERQDLAARRPFLTRTFVVSGALWVAASVILAIPHGPGHSIESMTLVVVLRDAAVPVAIGAFACILAGLALSAWRSLDSR